jgi:hypothetical protein
LSTPDAKVQYTLDGGSVMSVANSNVTPGSVVHLQAENMSGWRTALWEVFYPDEAFVTPAGWTRDSSRARIHYTGFAPPDFTMPTTIFGKWAVKLSVNGGGTTKLVCERVILSVRSRAMGLRDIAVNEFEQFSPRAFTADHFESMKSTEKIMDGTTHTWGTTDGLQIETGRAFVSTNNNTQTAVEVAIAADSVVEIEAKIVARKASATDTFAIYNIVHAYARDGSGAPAALGSVTTLRSVGSNSGAPPAGHAATIDLNGNNWRIRVTSTEADVDWSVVYQVTRSKPAA